jgi:hypothetical protein
VSRDPVGLPAAWCPQCGLIYRGNEALCDACGEDCRDQIVLVRRTFSDREITTIVMRWFAAAGMLLLLTIGLQLHANTQRWVVRDVVWIGGLLSIVFCVAAAILRAMQLGATHEHGEQFRARADGYASARHAGPARWTPWWPEAPPVVMRRPDGTVRVGVGPGGGTLGTGRGLMFGLRVPAGTSPGRVTRRVHELFAGATSVRTIGEASVISHCPACTYLLDVPAKLGRPGRCPECGWAFADDVVLFGHDGPSQQKRGPARRTLVALLPGLMIVGISLLDLGSQKLLRRRLPVSPVLLLYAVIFGVAIVAWLRRIHLRHNEKARAAAFAQTQLRPPAGQYLWLSRSGFARSNVGREPTPRPWENFVWRVTRHHGYVRVLVQPDRPTRLGKWWRRGGSGEDRRGSLWPTRPVDFLVLGSRSLARDLRAQLRAWLPDREHRRYRSRR